jgi:hypothetical protein
MKVAVVTPYHRERPGMLRRCHESVLRQSVPVTHFLVADGEPQAELNGWQAQHIRLSRSHGDYGNTPRAIGAMSALNQGFDAIAFLDADNWYAEDHVASLSACCVEKKCAVAFSYRHLVLASGEICPFEPTEDADDSHVDTSCILITKGAAFLLPMWAMMDPALAAIGDRVMLALIRKTGVPHAWTRKRTLFYQTNVADHYRAMGKDPPAAPHEIDWDMMRSRIAGSRDVMIDRLGFDPFIEPGDAS